MIGLARSQSHHAGRVFQRPCRHAFSQRQPLWNALRTHWARSLQGKACWWPTRRVVVTEGQIGKSRQGSTWAPQARIISSLKPANFKAMKQGVVDISEMGICPLTVTGHEDALQPGILHLTYIKTDEKRRRFPAGTRGVFYFHHVEGDAIDSQLRFRLCHSLDEFPNGSDLLLPDGRIWDRTLQFMARKRGAYAPFLKLLSQEFSISPAQLDPNLTSHRIITTLSRCDLVPKSQKVFDLSGMRVANFLPASSRQQDQNDYVRLFYNQAGQKHLPFPPETVGLLYYKQSLACPTEIGELRFRLCSDPSLFDQGSDLSRPSGDTWFFSSHELHTIISLRPLANMLYQEGLLKPLNSSLTQTIHGTKCPEAPVLTRLSQPFVLNLSHHRTTLAFQVGLPRQVVSFINFLWKQTLPGESPYHGRILVQFEEHPDSQLSPNPGHSRPIVQLRILELLTPVVKVGEVEHFARPESGKLHSVLKEGRYIPWTYAPRSATVRGPFSKFMESS